MDGWNAATRTVDREIPIDRAVAEIEQLGFEVTQRNIGHVIFNRPGTQWTFDGKKLPLELAVAEADNGLFVQVRYDTFVLGDTGDLDEFADEVVAHLVGHGE